MDSLKDWNTSENTVSECGEFMEMNPTLKSEVLFIEIGLLLWRGTEKPKEILEHDSYDYHTFEKLEFSNPKTRELVTEYWTGLEPTDRVEGLSAI
jgi:hypothetical protein